jgi:hypothetical protein
MARRNPSVVAGVRANALDAAMAGAAVSGGGIQPGAHPTGPTPLEKVGAALKKMFAKKSAKSATSPPMPGMSVAEEDALSKKYLGR